ncbi:MAG: arsenate reductase [Betaproteobacteria bacterium CG2_30_59_46]|nr:MAG: arsenate reductase [Betaproteobacteria bacterium CG2_30_59_46]PIQ13273.1 MAG: ArsC family reductase [Hydrogenophilales bacterium CG18_big_fil_WC_8_21_14_2_50_58_12]PIY01387.1 MAG: ArsC family reductase [Hydrogenophilales bacterium CG_4_10_14_3_um_filter_58_23]PJB07595.1 MAG: ArsC family reductase [Hydrogenophilales bacterium CG_4_9_14_3_um_filter_59_35]
MKLYGISNCNTVKKARTWLTENGIDIPFHDFKKQGISEELLKSWMKQIGWEKLVNRQGTTWRQLPDEAKAAVRDETSAIRLMLEKSSTIKRPVLEMDGKIILGFDEAAYQSLFGIK